MATNTPPPVISRLPALGKVKLADLPGVGDVLDEAVRRIVPKDPDDTVPVAAFNSVI